MKDNKDIQYYETLEKDNQEQYSQEVLNHLRALAKLIYINEYKEQYKENEEEIYLIIGSEEIVIELATMNIISSYGEYNFISEIIESLTNIYKGE